MDKDKALVVFQGKTVRRAWHNEQWHFVVLDIVSALTGSANPLDYLKKLRKRDDALNEGRGVTICPLRIETAGGPQNINCANTENAFRSIQSIPSKKAEPFKRWRVRRNRKKGSRQGFEDGSRRCGKGVEGFELVIGTFK